MRRITEAEPKVAHARRLHVEDGLAGPAAAPIVGISIETFYNWKKRWHWVRGVPTSPHQVDPSRREPGRLKRDVECPSCAAIVRADPCPRCHTYLPLAVVQRHRC